MILPNLRRERKLWRRTRRRLAGVDEVGRGALAGPLVAAAVWWRRPSEPFQPPFPIRDSKQMPPSRRLAIYQWLKRHPNFVFRTASASAALIDRVNIRQANLMAMANAVKKLPLKPQILLIDGKDQLPVKIQQYTYIRGDERLCLISLASIIAKVTRDQVMIKQAKQFPKYHFEIHKGYGTKKHLGAIKKLGPTRIHRKTFLGNLTFKRIHIK